MKEGREEKKEKKNEGRRGGGTQAQEAGGAIGEKATQGRQTLRRARHNVPAPEEERLETPENHRDGAIAKPDHSHDSEPAV
jgi:hypothetical protein